MLSKFGLGSRIVLSRHSFQYYWALSRFLPASSTNRSYSQLLDIANSDSRKQTEKHSSRVESIVGDIDLDLFRRIAWVPETPLLLRNFHNLPAIQEWFQHGTEGSHTSFSQYMRPYEDLILPYEFTVPHPSPEGDGSDGNALAYFQTWLLESNKYKKSHLPVIIEAMIKSSSDDGPFGISSNFQQFNAPLSLIMSASQFNDTQSEPSKRITNLYVTQSNLNDLPKPLFQDLPVPDIVKYAGKGDIYSSSIWLGLQPTYTPLHRDPNPNLFCQLVSSKRIRIIAPEQGDDIYARVRRVLGSSGNSRFRGAEMMEGRERELLHHAVWDEDMIDEVSLNPGDSLFIPKGWWHSVASSGKKGELNTSVNWWYR
ncbi:Clavaminate synthase-like protein [Daldinia decipiens]|uniref:Clavaminate synthase-like protein n=1 Tax=Daldinia decipiens TaxID=326647 RepID=UPI0020C390E2|nr:Clavaminate synthase-like protein [Daldinia decipiens]KAI1662338.1 Clavaminate synthase-like protein [Daldinia decipiens]